MPDWLGEAVVGVVAAVAGYFGKGYLDDRRSRRAARKHELGKLNSLRDLLDESRSVFLSQNYQARRLIALLRDRLRGEVPDGLGFDETFHRLHSQLEGEERELHALIRSTTMNSMRRLNGDFQSWLRENASFKQGASAPARSALAKQLKLLELHMNQWHDKYDAVIPGDERRSLVYLADEKRQGVGFPPKLA